MFNQSMQENSVLLLPIKNVIVHDKLGSVKKTLNSFDIFLQLFTLNINVCTFNTIHI